MESVQKSTVPGLSQAAWNENISQMESIAQGLVQSGTITQAEIINDRGEKIVSRTQKPSRTYRYLDEYRYDLQVDHDGGSYNVGSLSVILTLDPVYERLIRKALYFFLSQGLKTLLVSMVLLYVFNWYVVRHVKTMSKFLVQMDVKAGEFKWTRVPGFQQHNKYYNELDILANSVNDLSHALSRHNKNIEENLRSKDIDLQRQEGMALNAARQASLGEMAGAIAHEVNNPLAVISLQNEILLRNQNESHINLPVESVHKGHMKIRAMVERVSEVVESMMFLTHQSKIHTTEYITLESLSSHVKNITGETLRAMGINLTVHYLGIEKSDALKCNPVQLAQVLISLIHNAKEAIKDKHNPWIRLEYISLANSVSISVVDCGNGIPKEYRDKIFDPFFTTKKLGEGAGLGLSTSKKIITDHGWNLYLDANSRYCMFCIEISDPESSLKSAA